MLETLTVFILQTIKTFGYSGVFILMALEGSFIPVPSEIILPFSGYLVHKGTFSLVAIALWGTAGNVVGTTFTYTISRYLGTPFLCKYGKFFLVREKDIEFANDLFKKHGVKIIFISRIIPGIRGFVPIPAGVAKMKFLPFITYVAIGSFIYSILLTYVGVIAGENWHILGPLFSRFNHLLLGLLIASIIWWIWHHRNNK